MTRTDLYDIEITRIDGTPQTLGAYRDSVLLVVNVASECGFTPQYEGLQKLYTDLHERGFVVLGFPCNQFGAQEPGNNAEVAQFCSTRFGVTFPMFEKIDVNGPERHPLYRALIEAFGNPPDITWNFEKFLIDRNGKPIGRFAPDVKPDSAVLRNAIAAALG